MHVRLWVLFLLLASLLQANGGFFTTATLSHKTFDANINRFLSLLNYQVGTVYPMDEKLQAEFQDTRFEAFRVIPIFHKRFTRELILNSADAGIFLPYTITYLQGKDSKELFIGYFSWKTLSSIAGRRSRDTYQNLDDKVRNIALSSLEDAPKKIFQIPLTLAKKDQKLVWKKKMTYDGNDPALFSQTYQNLLLSQMRKAGFHHGETVDFMAVYPEALREKYDSYTVLSFHHLELIYVLSALRPASAMFVPGNILIYKKKNNTYFTIVYPVIENWISGMGMQSGELDKLTLRISKDLDKIFVNMEDKR